MELKLIMANIIVRYDVKPVTGAKLTPRYIGAARIPSYGLKISLKAR
jgi:hypothetical protein